MFDGHDPIWEGSEPFDRRSAWIDLCQMARHQGQERVVNGVLVRIERGQILASERFLAERWHWTRAKVRRYLVLLASEKLQRVVTKTDHQAAQAGAIITLCSYEDYNGCVSEDRPTMRPNDSTSNGPPKAQSQYQIKEREEGKKEESPPSGGHPRGAGSEEGSTKRKRSRMAPDDFEPSEEHRTLAESLGVDVDEELEKFRDHEFDKPKSRWGATFSNWLRNAARFTGGGRSRTSDMPEQGGRDWDAEAKEREVRKARELAESEAKGRWKTEVLRQLQAESQEVRDRIRIQADAETENAALLRANAPKLYRDAITARACAIYAAEKGIELDSFRGAA